MLRSVSHSSDQSEWPRLHYFIFFFKKTLSSRRAHRLLVSEEVWCLKINFSLFRQEKKNKSSSRTVLLIARYFWNLYTLSSPVHTFQMHFNKCHTQQFWSRCFPAHAAPEKETKWFFDRDPNHWTSSCVCCGTHQFCCSWVGGDKKKKRNKKHLLFRNLGDFFFFFFFLAKKFGTSSNLCFSHTVLSISPLLYFNLQWREEVICSCLITLQLFCWSENAESCPLTCSGVAVNVHLFLIFGY